MNRFPANRHAWLPVVSILVAWAGIAWFSCYRYQPVAVVPATAPADVFSAERAEAFVERLFRNATPHPAGSNAAFRNRIVDEFRALGYETELQQAASHNPNWRYQGELPVPLTNVIASRPASRGGPGVANIILAGHFDSHPRSPGVSDDGVAVAILLEIARMLSRGQSPGMAACYFLLTDGEEFGLLGAREFVRSHPLAHLNEPPLVINIEARGTSGPSLMFETSTNSRWLVDVFARSARRPFASSLFYEIYRYLPNDTDFTVFRDAGMPGLNFAFIGNVKNYHTADDNFDNLDRRSLQHQGENVWNVLRTIHRQREGTPVAGTSVYFDLYGYGVVRWPAGWTGWLVAAGILLGIAGMIPGPGRGSMLSGDGLPPSRPWRAALALLFGGLVVSVALGWLIQFGLRLDGVLDNPFPAYPLLMELTFWLWPLTAAVGITHSWAATTTGYHLSAVVFGLWAVLAAAAALLVNGGSYLLVVPLLVTAGFAVVIRLAKGWPDSQATVRAVSLVAAIAAGIIWLPLERVFYDAVGFNMYPVMVARIALVLTALLPVLGATRQQVLHKLFWGLVLATTGITMAAVIAH